MPTDTIISQIELREAQLENLYKSGFFTDHEIEKQAPALQMEINTLMAQLPLYGMTLEQYKEGLKIHDYYFSQMPSPALLNTWTTLGMNQISRG